MTDINKLIEEEAIKHIERNVVFGSAPIEIHEGFRKKAFIEGASFILHQNRWRKVEDEEPPLLQSVLFKVHVYADNYQSQQATVGHRDTGGYHLDISDTDVFKIEVEEWKPIE